MKNVSVHLFGLLSTQTAYVRLFHVLDFSDKLNDDDDDYDNDDDDELNSLLRIL